MDFISRWYHDHGQHVMQLLDPQTCIHRSAVNELIIWATLQTACWPIFFNLNCQLQFNGRNDFKLQFTSFHSWNCIWKECHWGHHRWKPLSLQIPGWCLAPSVRTCKVTFFISLSFIERHWSSIFIGAESMPFSFEVGDASCLWCHLMPFGRRSVSVQ